MAADDPRVKGWKILREQGWRSGVHGLFLEVECETCQAVVTTPHGALPYLTCLACEFSTFLRKVRAHSTLKSKAVERYKEHVRACTALNVEITDSTLFWYEIERSPELADPFPIVYTKAWEKALRSGYERMVQEQTTGAPAHGSRGVERTGAKHNRTTTHRTEQVREGVSGIRSGTYPVPIPQSTINPQSRGSDGLAGSGSTGSSTSGTLGLSDKRSEDERDAREDSHTQSGTDSTPEFAGNTEG